MIEERVGFAVKVRVIDKPIKWNEKTLALATKDELIADLLIRQSLINQIKKSKGIMFKLKLQYQLNWIKVLQSELKSRYVIDLN